VPKIEKKKVAGKSVEIEREETIGGILQVPLPRPRTRVMVLEHPAYFLARDQLLRFLESGIPAREDKKGDDDEEVNRATATHAR